MCQPILKFWGLEHIQQLFKHQTNLLNSSIINWMIAYLYTVLMWPTLQTFVKFGQKEEEKNQKNEKKNVLGGQFFWP